MKSRTRTRAVAIGGLVLLLLATTTASARTLRVQFDTANFAPGTAIDNQFWPLIAGTTQVYYAESADGCSVNELIVTGNTKAGRGRGLGEGAAHGRAGVHRVR